MEAFSFLKYWKSAGAGAGARGTPASIPANANTILTAVTDDDNDDDHSDVAAAGDDGPFFDLEFAEPVDDGETPEGEVVCVDGGEAVEVVEEESETEDVVKFRVSSSSETTDPKLSVSPSEDLFFRGQILPDQNGSDYPDPNSAKPQLIPVSLVRSATRLRVLMSGFKKSSRSDPTQTELDPKPSQEAQQRKRQLFTIKFRADEVPIISLFSRDHSSRAANSAVSSASSTSSSSSKSEQQSSSSAVDSDEKQNSKDGVQKYFKMVKPLYIRVSKRYGEKLRLSGQLTTDASAASSSPEKPTDDPPAAETEGAGVKKGTEKSSRQKVQGNLAVGLRVMMRNRLGKSKSAVAGVVHPAAPVAGIQQRDDSLVQQQEWIQGAILHCKRSFNASQDDEESPVLSRSVSDPSQEMTVGEMISNA